MIPLSLVGCLLITLSAATVDDIPLNHYPMIMSHDAGMGYTEPSLQNIVRWSKNQVGDLRQQVDCGARAFDMRGACGDDGVVRIHHGIFVIDVPLRKALEDLIAVAGERPQELLLVQYQQYLPDTEECRREVWKVSEGLGLMKSLGGGGDSCEKLRGLTVGEAKEYGKLANGGHIFVFEAGGNCTLGRGNLNCYTKPDDSQTFESCFPQFGSSGPSAGVTEMVDTLVDLASVPPPEDGRLRSTAGHWQYNLQQFTGILQYHSSLLMDVYFSDLHYWIANRTREMDYVGLLGLDNVCDRGLGIYNKLSQRIEELSSIHSG
ncbi:hypothetical protein FOZ63_027477 [Perkinsus olseni]|uniref:Phosphatidylinositol-specific phospholipase C X domain-containing protein n=1 Tax=Perkinsus olseni TaxID=32597 RepID=A0A7J6PRY5_PEROL|nr:hypothetical protein FOZ63_027477 [Perkinsus olseni]